MTEPALLTQMVDLTNKIEATKSASDELKKQNDNLALQVATLNVRLTEISGGSATSLSSLEDEIATDEMLISIFGRYINDIYVRTGDTNALTTINELIATGLTF
jgi:hypothetical protein